MNEQRIASYRVVRRLGAGGMGAVYEAVHEQIGRRAAIKVLHPAHTQNPEMATRFLNEARAVNRVQHPGMVNIYEHGTLEDGSAFIVMEYLAGETLSARLRRDGRLSTELLRLGRQIASPSAPPTTLASSTVISNPITS